MHAGRWSVKPSREDAAKTKEALHRDASRTSSGTNPGGDLGTVRPGQVRRSLRHPATVLVLPIGRGKAGGGGRRRAQRPVRRGPHQVQTAKTGDRASSYEPTGANDVGARLRATQRTARKRRASPRATFDSPQRPRERREEAASAMAPLRTLRLCGEIQRVARKRAPTSRRERR
jgi:hypothetical protein